MILRVGGRDGKGIGEGERRRKEIGNEGGRQLAIDTLKNLCIGQARFLFLKVDFIYFLIYLFLVNGVDFSSMNEATLRPNVKCIE